MSRFPAASKAANAQNKSASVRGDERGAEADQRAHPRLINEIAEGNVAMQKGHGEPDPRHASDDDHVWPRHAARRVQLEASSGASAATDLAWYSAEASCCALDWELSHSVPRVLDKDQRTCFKVGVAFRQHDRETLVNGVDAFIGESEDG